jgi:tRNA threonylcarbamoyladenosine biosynthesis protein TsaE
MPSIVRFIENEKDSIQLAAQLANDIKQNDIISFSGDLGAGKTFLCREMIKNLCGQNTQRISPTFKILQT